MNGAADAADAIAGDVVVLGRRAFIDEATLAITLLTALLLWRTPPVPEPARIVAEGLVGLLLPR